MGRRVRAKNELCECSICTSSAMWFIFHFRRGNQPQRNWLTWQRKYITFLVCVTRSVCVYARACVCALGSVKSVSLLADKYYMAFHLFDVTLWCFLCIPGFTTPNQPSRMVRLCTCERARFQIVLVRGQWVMTLMESLILYHLIPPQITDYVQYPK